MSAVILTWNDDSDIRLVSVDEEVQVFSHVDQAFAYADINDNEIETMMRVVDLDD